MSQTMHVRGAVLPDGIERDLFIRDHVLTFDATDDAITILDHGYLIPGLVDVHSHLPFNSPAPSGASWDEAARASAKLELDSGVLALRDPGGPPPSDSVRRSGCRERIRQDGSWRQKDTCSRSTARST